MFHPYKQSAFTLFELIICIALLAIITTIAIPFYHDSKERLEVAHVFPSLKQNIDFAKNTALTYHSDVVICASENLNSCQNNMWHKGMITFSDLNKNKKLDPQEQIFSVVATNVKYGHLKWNGNVSNLHSITFQGDTGLPRGAMGAFHYCHFKKTQNSQYLPLGMMGILRKESNATC